MVKRRKDLPDKEKELPEEYPDLPNKEVELPDEHPDLPDIQNIKKL